MANEAGYGRRLFELFRRERNLSLLVALCCLLLCLTTCLLPLLQRNLIDSINAHDKSGLLRALILLGGAIVLNRLGTTVQNHGSSLLLIRFRSHLKSQLFTQLLGLSPDFLQNRGVNYLSHRVQNDIGICCRFGAFGIFLWLSYFLKTVGALLTICFLQWQLCLLLTPFLGVQLWLVWRVQKRQYRLNRQLHEATAQELRTMHDFLSCHTLLRTHDGSEVAKLHYGNRLRRWKLLMLYQLRSEELFRLTQQIPVWLCCGGVFLWGIGKVWDSTWSLGELWAMIGLLLLVFAPARGIVAAFFQMQSVRAAMMRLLEVIDAPEETGGTIRLKNLLQKIEFDEIAFAYPGQPVLFRSFSCQIAPGEKILLAGPNGCGKSTLLALLLRFYHPAEGEIRIGDTAIREYDLGSYRKRIGYIGQNIEFFPGTIRDNLLMGREITDQKINAVLQRLSLGDRIRNLPGRFHAKVGEDGNNFSAGERLRLALARELFRESDILLLDEVTANLDAEGEQLIWRLMNSVFTRQTVIIIAHHMKSAPAGFRSITLPNPEPIALPSSPLT